MASYLQLVEYPVGETVAPGEGFRFVLCWLEDDRDGGNTKAVEKVFRGIPGVELVRSAKIVTRRNPMYQCALYVFHLHIDQQY